VTALTPPGPADGPARAGRFGGVLFALGDAAALGTAVAAAVGTQLSPYELRAFDGGEHKCRPLVGVRNRDVYVLSSLDGARSASVNDELCRLLFFVGALRDASARSVTAVVPYLAYARKDRRTKARDPVTSRYVAQLFEAVGTDRVVVVDVHNPAAFENAFRCRTDHLEAAGLFVEHVRTQVPIGPDRGRVVVVSPDLGGAKRAERFRSLLETATGADAGLAFVGKHRSRGVVSGSPEIHGDVSGATALVVDDLIASGTTMARVAGQLRARGAASVHLFATHAPFTAQAGPALFGAGTVDSVVVTDSVAPGRLASTVTAGRLVVLSLAGLLAEALRRIDTGGSISELLQLET